MRKTAWLAMLAAAGLAITASVAGTVRAAIQDNLVVHLKLDGNANDSSGRGNNGVPATSLFYLPASTNSDGVARTPFLGSGSLDLSYGEATEYITLANTLSDMQFGANTDFSVSVWLQRVINPNATGIEDPSIIGNKDWGGGGNQGWVLYAQNDGWGWNWKGVDGARRDFGGGRDLPAGEWHNITVTHDRDGVATFYQDGSKLGSASIAGSGSIDTTDLGLNTNIGQDGTGAYGPKLSHNVDDLGIWRRALSSSEVLTIAKQGHLGKDLSQILPADVLVPGDVNGDKVTNAADYAIWNANVGFTTGTGSGTDASYAKGDMDYNGVIDLNDFKIIAEAANPPLGVPEPSSILLAVCGVAGLALIRKFR